MTEPFDTAARRESVLAAWAGSPTRFREDANAEEDLVVGGYSSGLVIELAQNASDAAERRGVPGTLRIRYQNGVLSAANTGAPLDAAGVDGLTSLRASPKREGAAVGRFGVGFAAALAVSDEPEIRSSGGGVRFSAAATRESLTGIAADEAARRDGRVPVLRLPWPVEDAPPDGFDTEVRLPVRPGAEGAVAALLADVDDALLLSLPGLARLEIGNRVIERRPVPDRPQPTSRTSDGPPAARIADVEVHDIEIVDAGEPTRWRCVTRRGELAGELLAGRPVEERSRTGWSVLAAAPVDHAGRLRPLAVPQVVHAPTPSEEPLSLPVRLVASFPLDPDRRRVAAGAVTDFLVEQAAGTIVGLVGALAAEPGALALVPRPGLARAALDAAVCGEVLDQLADAEVLPVAGGFGRRVAGRDATVLGPDLARAAEPLVELLADTVPGLLPAGYAADRGPLDWLGVRRLDPHGLVDAVTGLDREPAWWHGLYTALAQVQADPDSIAALPVPLADGRTVTGARGALLPGDDLPAGAVSVLGLRVIDPAAAHPLLERLGARPVTARSVLADDRVRAAVVHSQDDDDPLPIAEAVLALVAAAGAVDEPWLAELALPAADGEWYPAGELLLPDSALAALLVPEAPLGAVDARLAARWGADVLTAVGCLATFVSIDESDVDLMDIGELELDRGDEWADMLTEFLGEAAVGARLERLRGVRDLEWVSPDAWPEALRLLSRPPLRQVLAAPAYAIDTSGHRIEAPSYVRWWLAGEPVLAGRRPSTLRTPGAEELAGLYDPAAEDEQLLALLGCHTSVDEVLAGGGAADLMDRLGDPARTAPEPVTPLIYARIAAGRNGVKVPPPDRIRVAPDRVVESGHVVVVDVPWRLGDLGIHIPVLGGSDPLAVAELLDVPLLSEL